MFFVEKKTLFGRDRFLSPLKGRSDKAEHIWIVIYGPALVTKPARDFLLSE